MVSEFFATQINMAHQLMNEGGLDEAVELLKNLDIRVHDKETLEKIKQHNNTIDKEYQTKYAAITGDPIEGYNQVVMLKRWRTREYIRFYDQMSKTNAEFK